jgi:hypothetical protein
MRAVVCEAPGALRAIDDAAQTSLDTVADDLRRWAGDRAGLVKAIVEMTCAEQDAFSGHRTEQLMLKPDRAAGPPA